MRSKALMSVVLSVLAGCTAVPSSRELSGDAALEVQSVRVILIAPGASPLSGSTRTDPGSMPESTGGFLGPTLVTPLIIYLAGGDAEADRKDSAQLLSQDGSIPNQEFARSRAQLEFATLASKATPIRIVDVQGAVAESQVPAAATPDERAASVMQVTLEQTMSVDLSRLRVRLRAKLMSAAGTELMNQNIFYLPASIAGATKQDSLRNWQERDGKLYREHVSSALAGAVDALDVTVFSRAINDPSSLPDAQALLKRKNCYGGDYDAGIPLSAYEGGRILPARSGINVIRLHNGDILMFPRCEA